LSRAIYDANGIGGLSNGSDHHRKPLLLISIYPHRIFAGFIKPGVASDEIQQEHGYHRQI
jgi:hypothetical protein